MPGSGAPHAVPHVVSRSSTLGLILLPDAAGACVRGGAAGGQDRFGAAVDKWRTDDWRMAEARNQAGSRETNDWIEGATDSFASDEPLTVYTCECGDAGCGESVSLTRAEYEAVRAQDTRFVIALDHENPEVERVVSETGRYAVIEKLPGFGADHAHRTDPRHKGG
jgi:hypothetical protein